MIAAATLSVVGGFVWWTYATPHIRIASAPTIADFEQQVGETDLPASATNIRFVWSSISLGGRAHIGRFAAPLDDGEAFAMSEYNSYAGDLRGAGPPMFVPMRGRLTLPDLSAYGIRDLEWFDVENVERAIVLADAKGRCLYQPFVCIDTGRNVVYTFWAD